MLWWAASRSSIRASRRPLRGRWATLRGTTASWRRRWSMPVRCRCWCYACRSDHGLVPCLFSLPDPDGAEEKCSDYYFRLPACRSRSFPSSALRRRRSQTYASTRPSSPRPSSTVVLSPTSRLSSSRPTASSSGRFARAWRRFASTRWTLPRRLRRAAVVPISHPSYRRRMCVSGGGGSRDLPPHPQPPQRLRRVRAKERCDVHPRGATREAHFSPRSTMPLPPLPWRLHRYAAD